MEKGERETGSSQRETDSGQLSASGEQATALGAQETALGAQETALGAQETGLGAQATGSGVLSGALSGGTGPVLVLSHAAKSFGAVHALLDGSIELYPGEVHALVGENGAGKSTLVKILAGVYQPDAGAMAVDGQEVTLHGPAMARAAGIAVIYQEPALFPDLTVAENMFIGRQPLRAGRRIDRRAMRIEAAAIFARLGVQLDPARIARGLSIADQQVVEIGKAISLEARVIVMDEPTAALSAAEVDRLFDVVRALSASGHRGAVHLAPARGGLRAVPAGHGDARRQAGADPAARRPGRG